MKSRASRLCLRFFSSARQLPKPIVGVNAVIFKENRLLLGRRLNSIDSGTWAFPAGHIEVNESPCDAAVRETKEETGLELIDPQLFARVRGKFSLERPYESHFVFGTIAAEAEPLLREPTKCDNWKWIHIERLPQDNELFSPIRILRARYPNIFVELAGYSNQRKLISLPFLDIDSCKAVKKNHELTESSTKVQPTLTRRP